TLKLALERAQRADARRVDLVTFYLVSMALQRNHLQEAENFSADLISGEARADRLRAIAGAAAPAPLEGAHLIRATVLIRLGRFDEAEKELAEELARGASIVGGLDDRVEAASLR